VRNQRDLLTAHLSAAHTHDLLERVIGEYYARQRAKTAAEIAAEIAGRHAREQQLLGAQAAFLDHALGVLAGKPDDLPAGRRLVAAGHPCAAAAAGRV